MDTFPRQSLPLILLAGFVRAAIRHQQDSCALFFSTVPKSALASTFTHGAGIGCPAPVVTTYSLPSRVNPPIPLYEARSRRGIATPTLGSTQRTGTGLNLPARGLPRATIDLFAECSGGVADDRPRHRLHEYFVLLRHLLGTPDKYCRRLIQHAGLWADAMIPGICSCNNCRYPDWSSFQITRSTASPFTRRYACAATICRASPNCTGRRSATARSADRPKCHSPTDPIGPAGFGNTLLKREAADWRTEFHRPSVRISAASDSLTFNCCSTTWL